MATDLDSRRGDVFPNFERARRKKRQRLPSSLPTIAAIDSLEVRRLLASASISGGVLTYTGDSVAEKVQVYRLTGPGQDDIHIRVGATDYGPFASCAITARIEVNAGSGNDQVVVEDSNDISGGTTPFGDAKLGTVAVQKVTRLLGSWGADTMYGGDQPDTINGGEDNDSLFGRSGNDTMYGYAGADYMEGGSGGEVMYGGDGLNSSDGGDVMWGQAGNDGFFGEGGTTSFTAAPATTRLMGGTATIP
jgi:Ca2+-binding RTX toxin-like protein